MRKLIPGIASVFMIVFAFGHFSFSQAAAAADTTHEYEAQSIRNLETASRLRELALLIDYYDEVLTQSARNYAFTRDKKWEKRYRESEPKLIATLEEALEKGDKIDREFLERIDKANLKLVEMEYRSIELVNAGQTRTLSKSEQFPQHNHRIGCGKFDGLEDVKRHSTPRTQAMHRIAQSGFSHPGFADDPYRDGHLTQGDDLSQYSEKLGAVADV